MKGENNLLNQFCNDCSERKPGSIDVHPSLEAIVLNYEIDVQILGNKDTSIYGEKQASISQSHLYDCINVSDLKFAEP